MAKLSLAYLDQIRRFSVDPETGNQILEQADPSAAGLIFEPSAGQTYFYVFFDSKTKRIAKGGKFALIR